MLDISIKKKLIAYQLKALILYFLIPLLIASCNSTDLKDVSTGHETTELNSSVADSSTVDTSEFKIIISNSSKKTTNKEVSKPQIKRQPQIRESEGVSDSKLNGEPILLQEELSAKILAGNPDTIKNYLKNLYIGQERNFPRSIADNFENGISTEHFSYPRLNYRVELFEDEYSKKPYKILGYSVRKEKEKIIVE